MKHIRTFSYYILLLFFTVSSYAAVSTKNHPTQDKLTNELTVIAKTFPGTVGLYLHDLKTNQIVTLNADKRFPMGSTYKVPVLVQLYRDVTQKVYEHFHAS